MSRTLICLDLDGTLIEKRGYLYGYYPIGWDRVWHTKYPALQLPDGIPVRPRIAANMEAAGIPVTEDGIWRTVRSIVEAASQAWWSEWRHQVEPTPGAIAFVQALSRNPQTRRVLGTANMGELARQKAIASGIAPYVDFGSSGYGEDAVNSRSEIVGRTMDLTGIDPGNTVVVDDAVVGVEAARAVGARVVAVATGSATRAELLAAGPDVLLDDLTDTDAALAAVLGRVPSRSLVAA